MAHRVWTSLAVLAAGIALGGASALIWLKSPRVADIITVGAWQTSLTTGSAAADPYTRTHIAITALLALNRSETTYFSASRDDSGQPLRSACTYDVLGPLLDARWWSITAYADDNFLIPNASKRFSHSNKTVTQGSDGRFTITLGPTPRNGDWLPTGERGGFNLLLRLYNPGDSIARDPRTAQLPRIVRQGACAS
jgi:hypothetical protein